MLRRLLGIVMLFVALVGVAISVAGVIVGRQLIDNIGGGLDQTLTLTSQSLDTVGETLLLTKDTVDQVGESIVTVETTATNLAQTVNETRPLLQQVSEITTGEVPDSLDSIQSAIPQMAEVASAVDDTLTILNSFQIDQNILGIPIQYDLGINYEPSVPFDQTINDIGGSLDGIPARLRSMEVYMGVADDNLLTISTDMIALSRDLASINNNVAEISPLLDDYLVVVADANDLIRQTRTGLQRDLEQSKLFITLAMVWIGLSQVAPLYLGIGLLRGGRLLDDDEIVVEENEQVDTG